MTMTTNNQSTFIWLSIWTFNSANRFRFLLSASCFVVRISPAHVYTLIIINHHECKNDAELTQDWRNEIAVWLNWCINKVNQHRARLVLAWVTDDWWVNHLLECNQLPRSTQHGHPKPQSSSPSYCSAAISLVSSLFLGPQPTTTVKEKNATSFPGFFISINLLFHKLWQQNVIVKMVTWGSNVISPSRYGVEPRPQTYFWSIFWPHKNHTWWHYALCCNFFPEIAQNSLRIPQVFQV